MELAPVAIIWHKAGIGNTIFPYMNILENVRLAEYTTFKIGGPARFFCSVSDETELLEAVGFARDKKLPIFVLGGGSNILIGDKGFDGLVIKIGMMGIQDVEESDKKTIVSVGAGEQWDGLVEKTVERGLYGLENLSAIPGTVGAAPVQNIGAYGSEVSQTIVKVRAFDRQKMEFVDISNMECHFSYRDSLFKKEKNHYIITRVDFRLSRKALVNIGYKDIKDYFFKKDIAEPSLKEIREAVIDIRWNKLPDWRLWGTAGSFFKNPIVPSDKFSELKKTYANLPGFPEPDGRVKVSLGWILDNICHVKGMQKGHVQVYEKQALVLVAKPGATSEEVVSLANELMRLVKEKTGIEIEGEVEWVN